MTYSAFILKILHIGFVNHYQTAVFWVPGERRCYKEKAEKALKSAGWVQDNMDVRAEATKAVLCSTLRVESLCWQPHIDPHCVCGSSMEPGVHLHPHKVTWIPPDVSDTTRGESTFIQTKFWKWSNSRLRYICHPASLWTPVFTGNKVSSSHSSLLLKLGVWILHHLLHSDMKYRQQHAG